MTSEQVRAGRALLRWDQRELARMSRVPLQTIKRLETIPGPLAAREGTIDALKVAFEAAGVEFTDGARPGVRLGKKGE